MAQGVPGQSDTSWLEERLRPVERGRSTLTAHDGLLETGYILEFTRTQVSIRGHDADDCGSRRG